MTLRAEDPGVTGVRVLTAAGEIDAVVAPGLQADLPLAVEGVSAVVLDLSGVTFFDSAGVRLIDTLARACAASGTGLRVVAPPGSTARRVLEIVGMGGGVVDDVATARSTLV